MKFIFALILLAAASLRAADKPARPPITGLSHIAPARLNADFSSRTKSQLGEIVGDFDAVPVHRADEFAADYSGAIDDVGFGPTTSAI